MATSAGQDYAQNGGYGLDLSGFSKAEIFKSIWGPGSNGIDISGQRSKEGSTNGGGLNYSTQAGVGWSKSIKGINATGFSIQSDGGWLDNQWTWVSDPQSGSWKPADGGDEYNFLTIPGFNNNIVVTLPSGARAIIFNLEDFTVAGSNYGTSGNTITFAPVPRVRYGGFAWYDDNRQASLEINARSDKPIPVDGFANFSATSSTPIYEDLEPKSQNTQVLDVPGSSGNSETTGPKSSDPILNHTTIIYNSVTNVYNTIDNSINNSNVNSNNVTDSSTTNTTSTNNSVAVNVPDVGGSVSIDLSSLVQGSTKGPDSVVGTRSGDVIGSGRGVDTLTGEAGSDQFLFNTRDKFGLKGADVITDFDPSKDDQLVLGQAALRGISEILFAVVRSKKSLNAATQDDANLIYLEPTGELFYDQNGSGKGFGKGGLFAILENTPALSADDFALL